MRRQILSMAAVIGAAFAISQNAAAADDARVTVDLNMRAGPATSFPVVDVIPDNGHVTVFGCIDGYDWCDVSWQGTRGWVAANYLRFAYRDRYVPIIEYSDYAEVPVIAFSVGPYWDTYYRNRPWYHRRAHWRNVWRHHHRHHARAHDRADRRDARRDRRLERLRDRAERRDIRRDRRAERRHDARQRRMERRDARRDRRRDNRAERRLRRERNVQSLRRRLESRQRRLQRAQRSMRRRDARSGHRPSRIQRPHVSRSMRAAPQRSRGAGGRGPRQANR
jgi:uncharacterized protein YraI